MLRDVYLHEVVNGNATSNGNWELTMMEATIGIAVFLEDRAVTKSGTRRRRRSAPPGASDGRQDMA